MTIFDAVDTDSQHQFIHSNKLKSHRVIRDFIEEIKQTLLNPLQEGQEKASLGNNSAQKNIGQKIANIDFIATYFGWSNDSSIWN